MAGQKDRRLNIRLTDSEHAAIVRRAQMSGLGVSEYIRRCALQDVDRPIIQTDIETLQKLYRDFKHAGGNVNQIACELNTRHRPDQLEAEIHTALISIEHASSEVSNFIEIVRQSV